MRRHVVGLIVLFFSATTVVGPAYAAHGGFGFHRPFFFHGPAFHDRFAHRPFFFGDRNRFFFGDRDRFFRPFAFGFPFFYFPPPYAGYPPGYAAYPAAPVYGQGSCQQVETTIMVDGRPQPAYVVACPQPDGTWRVP